PRPRTRDRSRGGYFYLATSGDFLLATSGYFDLAIDTTWERYSVASGGIPNPSIWPARPLVVRAPQSTAMRSAAAQVDRASAMRLPSATDSGEVRNARTVTAAGGLAP
ncbi:MAG: hypothetical protein ACYDD6_09650, partial [Acidimicrobiales bacterium]